MKEKEPLKENTLYIVYTVGVTVLLVFFIAYSILISVIADDLAQVVQGCQGGIYYGQNTE